MASLRVLRTTPPRNAIFFFKTVGSNQLIRMGKGDLPAPGVVPPRRIILLHGLFGELSSARLFPYFSMRANPLRTKTPLCYHRLGHRFQKVLSSPPSKYFLDAVYHHHRMMNFPPLLRLFPSAGSPQSYAPTSFLGQDKTVDSCPVETGLLMQVGMVE